MEDKYLRLIKVEVDSEGREVQIEDPKERILHDIDMILYGLNKNISESLESESEESESEESDAEVDYIESQESESESERICETPPSLEVYSEKNDEEYIIEISDNEEIPLKVNKLFVSQKNLTKDFEKYENIDEYIPSEYEILSEDLEDVWKNYVQDFAEVDEMIKQRWRQDHLDRTINKNSSVKEILKHSRLIDRDLQQLSTQEVENFVNKVLKPINGREETELMAKISIGKFEECIDNDPSFFFRRELLRPSLFDQDMLVKNIEFPQSPIPAMKILRQRLSRFVDKISEKREEFMNKTKFLKKRQDIHIGVSPYVAPCDMFDRVPNIKMMPDYTLFKKCEACSSEYSVVSIGPLRNILCKSCAIAYLDINYPDLDYENRAMKKAINEDVDAAIEHINRTSKKNRKDLNEF